MATYFIDYVGGNDSLLGTSKTTPWKRAPYMRGFGGSYSHAAGDRFIFKGGVTWPATCFQMKILAGGSSPSVRDYYGVDQTWFSGSSYSRPLFDFQNTLIGTWGGWVDAAGVYVINCSNFTFEGIEFARHRAPLGGAGISNYGSTSICLDGCSYFTLLDCVIRDWSIPPLTVPTPDWEQNGGGGIVRVNSGTNNAVSYCLFHQDNVVQKCGTAIWNIGTVEYTELRTLPNVIMGAQLIRNCWIRDIPDPADPHAHGNVALCSGGLTAYNNLIHDTGGRAQVIFIAPGQYGASVDTIYNNVVYNVAQPCVAIDTDGANNQSAISRIFNNTLMGPGGTGFCVRVIWRSGGAFGGVFPTLDCRNNHYVTSGLPLGVNNTSINNAPVTNLTNTPLLTQTVSQAAIAGYTPTNAFRPASGSSPTVNLGADLSAFFTTDYAGVARVAPFDLGAYEHPGSSLGTVSRAVSASWGVQAFIASAYAAGWNVWSQVSPASRGMVWNTRQAVSRSRSGVWVVEVPNVPLPDPVILPVAQSRSMLWNVLADVAPPVDPPVLPPVASVKRVFLVFELDGGDFSETIALF